jgi:hypothetical protein
MDLTHQHLQPIFASINTLLSANPEQLDQFEVWANEQALRLRRSAEQGKASLAYESELLRDDLSLLTPPAEFERMLTERTERMRLCQRLWLTGLTDFVDDLLEDQVPEQLAA